MHNSVTLARWSGDPPLSSLTCNGGAKGLAHIVAGNGKQFLLLAVIGGGEAAVKQACAQGCQGWAGWAGGRAGRGGEGRAGLGIKPSGRRPCTRKERY